MRSGYHPRKNIYPLVNLLDFSSPAKSELEYPYKFIIFTVVYGFVFSTL